MSVYGLTQNNSASDLTVTTAATTICDAVADLDTMSSVSVQFRFSYGSGGTSCKAYLQTTFDDGVTWVDIACRSFTTASATKVINLSALTPVTTAVTPSDGALTDNTSVDGLLGDQLRVKVISTGTYADSTVLSIRAVVH